MFLKIDKIKEYKFYILSFLIFAIISNIQINDLENKYSNLYEGIKNINCIATIISEREETLYKAKYIAKVESVNGDKKYNGTNLILYVSKNQKLEYGDKVSISGVYEKTSIAKNYKAFDYSEYLKTKNIYGVLNGEKVNKLKCNNLNIILILINKLRIKIKLNLKEILGEDVKIAMRNSSSEIFLKYLMKL